MGDDITIGVTEIVNNIEVTAQPNDQIVEIDVVDNSDEVTLNITPTVIEININKGSSFARWGDILGNLPDQEDLQNVLNLKADLVGGLVPASQLPSYVDDIVEVANYAALPVVGETDKIYLTLDNNKIFRWSGSVYIEIAANTAVWGAITGTLSSQTDLQTALDTKALKTITITPSAPLSGGGDLSANRTISISQSNATTDGYLSSIDWNTFNDKQYALNGTGFVKISGTTISYDNSTYVPTSRTLTINGTAYDLSTNRSWTIPTHDAVTIGTPANGLSLSGQVLSLSVAHSLNTGALSSTDWTTFNNKIGGSGTINYIPKFTASGAIGNSNIFDNGAYVDILTGAFIAGNLNVKGVVSSGVPADTLSILSGSGAIFVKNSASNTAYAFQLNTSSGLDLWSTNSGGTSTRRMTLDSSGNLGIGTTSPAVKFHSYGGALSVGDESSYSARFSNNSNKGVVIGYDSTNNKGHIGSINPAVAWTDLILNANGGNVGIGTTSPSNLLSVGVANSTTGKGITIENTSGSVYGRFGVINPTVDNDTYIGSMSNNNFLIYSNATERMRITSGGNVLIGTSTSDAKLRVSGTYNGTQAIFANVDGRGLEIATSLTAGTNEAGSVLNARGAGSGTMIFQTDTTERMRITSGGDVLVGISSTYTNARYQSENITGSKAAMALKAQATTGSTILEFWNPNGQVGSVSTNGSLTSFNVTSDYRLKQDFKPFNGLYLVSKIKVYDYEWKADNSRMNGVIAHELQEVVPYAVTGEKDAKEMQQVDYSKLVPILVQAIQELKAEIEILKNK